MKTIEVTRTVTEQVQFPYEVPCIFKYSENQDNPADFDGEEFHSCLLLRVDEKYKVSQISIRKFGLISDDDFEFNTMAKSYFNIGDIVSKKMPLVHDIWWDSAKKVVADYWVNN